MESSVLFAWFAKSFLGSAATAAIAANAMAAGRSASSTAQASHIAAATILEQTASAAYAAKVNCSKNACTGPHTFSI